MRRTITFVVAVALLVLGTGSAVVLAEQGGDGVVVNSWALAPTGTDPSEPGSRPYLSYDVRPGDTIHDSVTLWNYSNVQLTFQIYATDAFNNSEGAFELLAGGTTPKDTGSWVTLPQGNVTARPDAKIDLPFTITVPADARPGDHAGAILAANQAQGTGPDGKVVRLDRRTGARMYVRVAGDVRPALTVENVHTVYHSSPNPLGGNLDVTYTVRNTGNVRMRAHQRLEAAGAWGLMTKHRAAPDLPEILPGNALTRHEHFSGVPALLRAGATISLEPFTSVAGAKPAPKASRDGHTWAIPWGLLVLGLAIWLARESYLPIRNRRREMQRPPVDAPPSELTRVS